VNTPQVFAPHTAGRADPKLRARGRHRSIRMEQDGPNAEQLVIRCLAVFTIVEPQVMRASHEVRDYRCPTRYGTDWLENADDRTGGTDGEIVHATTLGDRC